MSMENGEKRLDAKDIRRCTNRLYIGAEMSNSYERLQALVFCVSMIPALKKLYTNKDPDRVIPSSCQFRKSAGWNPSADPLSADYLYSDEVSGTYRI